MRSRPPVAKHDNQPSDVSLPIYATGDEPAMAQWESLPPIAGSVGHSP